MRSLGACFFACLVACAPPASPERRVSPAPAPDPSTDPDLDADGFAASVDCDDSDPTAGEAWAGSLLPQDFAHFCDAGLSRCVLGDLLVAAESDDASPDRLECLTRVDGNVAIGSTGGWGGCYYGQGVTSLEGLAGLRTVGESLAIQCTGLSNLHGLEALESVGGGLSIGEFGEDYAIGNDLLTSVGGLDSLSFVGGWVHVVGNPALTSLSGLDALSSVGSLAGDSGSWQGDLAIESDWGLTSLDGLGGLKTLAHSLLILDDPTLRSLGGLGPLAAVPGGLEIEQTAVADLHGVEGITTVGGDLSLWGDWALLSVAGLETVTRVGGSLTVSGDESLASLDGLANVSWVGEDVVVGEDPALDPVAVDAFVGGIDHVGGSIATYP